MTELMLLILVILFVVVIILSCMLVKGNKTKDIEYVNESLLQKIFDIMGANDTADGKIECLNKAIITNYNAKYSSIVLFDGNKNVVKASNVEKTYISSICNIASDNIFKSNISRNAPKFVTTNSDATLLYSSAIERKIKSALLIPIYYKNSYLGYVFLEDVEINKFEHIRENEVNTLKKNIAIFLENINFQSTIEVAETIDKQTGFLNNMYLYSDVRNILNEYDDSVIAIVYLKGLADINEKYNRNIGNALLVKLANVTKSIFPKQTIFIRYSGLRFLIIIPGYTAEKSHSLFERLLSMYKLQCEYYNDEKVTLDTQIVLRNFKKQGNIEAEVQNLSLSFSRIKDVNIIKIM